MPETEITTITEDQLKRLEDQVRKGSAAFIAVGTSLAKIREGKGYRLRGFDTFESYCQKEFGFTDRQGRRLIQSAETSAEVKKITGAAPANESVAREWAPVSAEPEKVQKVIDHIQKKGYTVLTATAEAVHEAVQKLAPKPRAVTPGKGQAVVVPGNGHKSEPAKLEAPDGLCPHCGELPDRYERADEVWVASCCGEVVMVTAIKWPPEETATKVCPACKHEVRATHRFCDFCGGVL